MTTPCMAAAEQEVLMIHSGRLADRMYGFVLVRFAAGIAFIVAPWVGGTLVGVEDLPYTPLLLLASLLLICNILTFFLVKPYNNNPPKAHEHRKRLLGVLHFSIIVDFLILTVALWLVGGIQSPFQAFFIFHLIIVSVLLSTRAAYYYALFAYLLFATLVLLTFHGMLPAYYPLGAVPNTAMPDGRYVLTVLTVQAFLFTLTAMLVTYLMRLLNEREHHLIKTNCELDVLSKQRRDFSHLALHNLRSPVGAVMMMLQNMKEGYGGELTDQQTEWVQRSLLRLEGMSTFLNDVDALSFLESGELELYVGDLDMNALLDGLTEEYRYQAQAHQQTLRLEVEDNLPPLKGIKRLIREALANFITNAIKYSLEPGIITLRATRRGEVLRIEVEDQGIGIPEEAQGQLFKEFVRVHKDDPKTSHIEGSGMGLYIVAQIVQLHHGSLKVQSSPGQGSTFAIEFPIQSQSNPV